jgi:hypothetical protein
MRGDWSIVRGSSAPICTLTLETRPTRKDEMILQVKPMRCRRGAVRPGVMAHGARRAGVEIGPRPALAVRGSRRHLAAIPKAMMR